jgi:ubiquinone biosynthesis protein
MMQGPTIPRFAYRDLRRFQHVVNVLLKHGFGEILTRIRIWECVHIERRLLKRKCELPELTLPERLRLALEELGPTFIKLGQMLSTRPDIVSPEIISELKKLQLSVHFIPVETIKRVIQTELKKPVSELFDSFDEQPLAAASLAQVHRAVYKGKPVVLKVQRPNIENTIQEDISIMRTLVSVAERYSSTIYLVNPVGLVDEFAEQLKNELDFRMEGHNMTRFAQNFSNDETIRVPVYYPELSTKRVITMEFLDGINVSETKLLSDRGYDLQLIARRGAVVGFKATFEHGFFHADPHPGNIIVLPGNVIGLVDYGMMAVLSQRDRERLAKLVYFIAVRDEKRVARSLNELMESDDIIPSELLESAMSSIIKEYADVPLRDLHLAGMLFAMMRAIVAHGARLRPQLLWLTKSMATQEDISHSLEADFNMIDLGQPYASKVLTDKFNPLRQPQELWWWLQDTLDVWRDLPYDLGILLRELRKGHLKIEFEHLGLEPIRSTIERVSNRLFLTIIIAALLISSSVVTLAKVPPFIGSMPVIAFTGFIISLILSVILTISIIFRGRS